MRLLIAVLAVIFSVSMCFAGQEQGLERCKNLESSSDKKKCVIGEISASGLDYLFLENLNAVTIFFGPREQNAEESLEQRPTLEQCQTLKSTAEKKDCFTKVVKAAGIDHDIPVVSVDNQWGYYRFGKWNVWIDYADNGAFETARVFMSGTPGDDDLAIQCRKDEDLVFIDIGSGQLDLHPEDGVVEFLTWFGDTGPQMQNWKFVLGGPPDRYHYVTLETAVGEIGRMEDFLRKIMEAQEVTFQFGPAEHTRQTLNIDTRTLAYAMFPLLAECPF